MCCQRPGGSRIGALVLLLAVLAPVRAPAQDDPRVLVPGDTIHARTSSRDAYSFAVEAGSLVDVVVTDEDGALGAVLKDGGGGVLLSVDRQTGAFSAKRLMAVAASRATWTLVLTVDADDPGEHPYAVALASPRAAGEIDRRRIDALAALLDADRLARPRSAAAHRAALAAYDRSLEGWRSAGDRGEEAQVLFRRAVALAYLSEFTRALEDCLAAAEILHALGDTRGEGRALHNAGAEYYNMGDLPRALEYYRRALPLRRESGDRDGEAYTISAIGAVSQGRGEALDALDHELRAYQLWREVGNREGQARALYSTGMAYRALGDYQQALELFERSLALQREVGSGNSVARALTQIGNVQRALGDPDRAIASFLEALPLRERSGDRRGIGYTTLALGGALLAKGDRAAATEKYRAAAAAFQAVGDRDGEGQALYDLAHATLDGGDAGEALATLGRAESIYRDIGGRRHGAFVDMAMGDAHARLGRLGEALDRYRRALETFRAIRAVSAEAGALVGLADLERRAGQLDAARDHAYAGVDILERVREDVSSTELRASYLEHHQPAYELLVDIEMALHARAPAAGHDRAAFTASERGRARGLVDLLVAHGHVRRGVDPDALRRATTLSTRLERARTRLSTLLAGTSRAEAVRAAEQEVGEITAALADAERQIAAASPEYAALMRPTPPTVTDVQRLVGDDTVLVEYALGADRSYAWTVGRDGVRVAVLPPRARIERAARQAWDLVARSARRPLRVPTARALEELSALVLSPIAPALTGRRVAIVADGALQYVPFAALPDPRRPATPLVDVYEIVALPSAAALAALAANTRGRPEGELAVFADPARQAPKAERGDAPVRSDGPSVLDRLPQARLEARAIAALAARDRTLVAVDAEATRRRAIDSIGRYRLVHFATHAIVDDQRPERSGIVLAASDGAGSPDDGFLRLEDVYNLRLQADLVVLSACRTALGRESRGEGLVGLTRGFFYAGAPAVVASLWDVRDRSTAELMTRFYRAMLRGGLAPAAALRDAQRSMRRDPRWAAPAHWAGFLLHGSWRID